MGSPYLLDTHALLWFLAGDDKLSETAKDLIVDGDNDIYLSIASLWEISIKVGLGKLALHTPFDEVFPEQLTSNYIELIPIDLRHLSHMIGLALHHRDPFDRLIISQAIIEGLPIIGRDRIFHSYPVTVIW